MEAVDAVILRTPAHFDFPELAVMYLTYLTTVAFMWAMAAMSPGPNFLAIAQIAASQSRAKALAAVSGTGVATLVWGVCGVAGVQTLFMVAPWAFLILKIGGAAYLVYMGGRMFVRSFGAKARDTLVDLPSMTTRKAFGLGLATGLANPRSALSVASVFAVALPQTAGMGIGVAAIATMIAVSVSWYALVAFLFTTPFMSGLYQRFGYMFDRVAGGLLAVLGVRLALKG